MPSIPVRFAQFNASLNRNSAGQLVTDLSTPGNAQARAVAEIIQRTNADVLLINEFDYVESDPLLPVRLLQENYLSISQNGAAPVEYPYVYIAPSNTGIATGFDLNNNGVAVTTPETPGYGDDSFGFGQFPGQFGMLLLSKYPIDTENVRTFQNFRWQDMPGNLLTNDPTVDNPATAVNENLSGFYSPEEQAILRLSSKSHWDVPIQLPNGETVHALVSHPTPPVFDGPEDRNGKRNFDEIRFWSDYITPGQGDYIYDDDGNLGGLVPGSSFVIMGDQNADPNDGDSYQEAVLQLLQNPNINTNSVPASPGGPQQAALQGGANRTHGSNPAFDTADFADTTPGNLRADYVLPSVDLDIANSGIFWPLNTDPAFPLVGTFTPSLPGGFPSSDHRLVYVDVTVGATATGQTVLAPTFQGQVIIPTGFVPAGNAGAINGQPVPLGGLSGVTFDAANNRYFAISDDRAENGPARFYTFTADLSVGSLGFGTQFTDATAIRQADGSLYPRLSLDPEGIALTQNGTVFISSEGEANAAAGRVTNPFVNEYSLDGSLLRSLPVPGKFQPRFQDTNGNGITDAGDTQTSGVRNNLAFESLTITPSNRYLYTATENALFQDGPAASLTAISRSRILQYNLLSGQPEKEYLYEVDPVAQAPSPATAFSTNGLVDLLALDDRGTMLAVERSFSAGVPGTGNTIKIYEISLQGATDISVYESLSSLTAGQLAAITPVQKRLLLNLDDLNLPTGTDNIEGITFGPKLPDGRQSIVLVSDNNFSPTQFTQILAIGTDVLPTVTPFVETRPVLLDNDEQSEDGDDPAIYVHPTDPSKSFVITSVKDGGLRVYDLGGNLIQTIAPNRVRYNNVDVLYGFELNGEMVDLAVVSDRRNDKVVFFRIDPDGEHGNFLTNVTAPSSTIFQAAPFEPPYSVSSRSAYGIAAYSSPVTGDDYVFVNRRETGDMAQLRLVDAGNGQVGVEQIRNFTVPIPAGAPANTNPQLEGMVVDKETGILYIGQENVGIWKYGAEPGSSNTGILIDTVKKLGGQHLTDDVEGLTIYYGADGTGYLLASSQGNNTFAVYSRQTNEFLGRFAVGPSGRIDGVQESDGADVINLPLGPNFPFGLFVTQDGSNDPGVFVEDDGEIENISSNFKFIPWENIATAFPEALQIDPSSFDPRNPAPIASFNGIASGDTTQDSTVLWANSNFVGNLTFEYSTSPHFCEIAGSITATVTSVLQPAKVQVDGLEPNTTYYYRVTNQAGISQEGQFKTAAAVGTFAGLRFGASGDWRGELSPYPAIANAATENLTFFIELGDTIYADVASPAVPKPQAMTLEEFRLKQREVYSERFGLNTWGDLRATTSILATIDDHEVTNDFEGGKNLARASAADQALYGATSGLINDSPLYEIGMQAFQEYNPIRDEFYSSGLADPRMAGERKLYRYNTFGSDAATFILDARSFRDEGLPPVTNLADPVQVGTFLAASFNPSRTFLGRQQIADLKRDLLDAETQGITWKYVVVPEPIQNLGVLAASDRFEGYAAERTEILKFIHDNDITNVVFVAADIHGTVINNLTYQTQPGGPQIATSAFEITTGAVAYDAPFGPTVAELGVAAGIISPQQKAIYDALPIAGKDAFIKQIINGGLQPLGYDPVGLDANLAIAAGKIDATLLQGDYVATHTYGWTLFDVDESTQNLTVTTYGIAPYTEAELLANRADIVSRTPVVVSQFEVRPTVTQIGSAQDDVLIGRDGKNKLVGLAGNDFLVGSLSNDTLVGGAGADIFVLAPEGTDTILDFNLGEGDRIGLTEGLSFGSLTLTQSGVDTLIRSGTETLAVLTGVQSSVLSSDNFVAI
ncbi:MAG: phytase [Leptolyngbyaceae cyanobacterium bins.349]|nr:phytase [Leptolyngbyaceae cyanobacterium bins.349]